MWTPTDPENFSRFQASDFPKFLEWFEREFEGAIALSLADVFVEGVAEPYLEAIATNQPLPEWVETCLRWRLAAQWTYQLGKPLSQRLQRGMGALFPADEAAGYAERFKLTPEDIANIPPSIRQAFIEGAGFSLSWVRNLSDDARSLIGDILSAQTLKNQNPMGAVPYLERVLRRDLVARELGMTPSDVTPEMVEEWLQAANEKVTSAIATRAKAIARTETMQMMNLGILSSMEQDGEALAYISPHAGSCPECQRLIDGRVFRIETLKANRFANYGKKKKDWVAATPQHVNCRHAPMRPPFRFRDALRSRSIPDEGLLLEFYGLPNAADMAAIGLSPQDGWLRTAK
jgi:hypothetical protein